MLRFEKFKNKFKNITTEYHTFRYFDIRNFEIPKYWSFYISSFQILTPTLIFYYSDFRKFGRFTFARSLIFEFEISAILKFYCSKFRPSPIPN